MSVTSHYCTCVVMHGFISGSIEKGQRWPLMQDVTIYQNEGFTRSTKKAPDDVGAMEIGAASRMKYAC